MTGWLPGSTGLFPDAIDSICDLANIRSTSRILMEASTDPVATKDPSILKAPARQFAL